MIINLFNKGNGPIIRTTKTMNEMIDKVGTTNNTMNTTNNFNINMFLMKSKVQLI